MEVMDKKYPCRNIFVHPTEDIADVFTELWTQLINEKENSVGAGTNKNVILQTNTLGL